MSTPSTNWSPVGSESTSWDGSPYIVNLGVLMNDPNYLMNDLICTMNDQIPNPLYPPSTNYDAIPVNSTNWMNG